MPATRPHGPVMPTRPRNTLGMHTYRTEVGVYNFTLSRRTFIKGLGIGAAAATCPGLIRVARAAPGPTESEIAGILSAALSRGGHYADLFLETRVSTNISMANSEIEGLEYGVLQGGGVRALSGEKTGYAYAETLDPEPLREAAGSAARIASGEGQGIAVVVRRDVPRIITTLRPIEDEGIAAKIAILNRVDRAARAVSPDVQQVVIDYADAGQRFTLANSDGVVYNDALPLIYLRITVNAARGDAQAEGMVRVSYRRGMEQLDGDVPEQAGRQAAEQAIRMLEAQPAPTGEMPVVVAAGGGVIFHEAVGHGLEADGVLRQATVFAGRVGEKVATDLVTLYDDATIPMARGSFNIDDEGTPATKTLLIEKGILHGFMQDRRTAHAMRETSTGNGRRMSFRYPVVVRMTNTNLAPGTESPEEIIKATPRGIYAVEFGGGEVDTTSGQFTFGLREAYLIENGKVTAPIKGANLVGSGPEVLQRIDRVGSDFASWPGTCGKSGQWVPVTSGCPTLRISAITVGGTA
jgi:TldD protein